ncbi:MAG: glycosyltransferase [Planctomycetes bacterium]|nr:glycosyltransferase [Planctomycetota bacterium]
MKVSGFTFVRNALKYDFPVTESIRSILPIVDEFIVNVGKSEDDTVGLIQSIADSKIRIIENSWNETIHKGGLVYSEQTNLALAECKGDWAFYLQADEVVHEEELPRIQVLMEENLDRAKVLGLLFRYFHFYGDYKTLNPWFYRKEIRVIRNNGKVRSIGDAVGFYCTDDPVVKNLKDDSPERFVRTGCHIYHYGWVKNPKTMLEKKIHHFSHYLEMTEEELRGLMGKGRKVFEKWGYLKSWDTILGILKEEWQFDGYDFMKDFRGSHPKVMGERIKSFIPLMYRTRSRWLNPRFYTYVLKHGFKS